MRRLLIAACASLTLAAGAQGAGAQEAEALAAGPPAAGPGSAAEPAGLWMGPMPGYTPSTLKGASVVEAPAVAALARDGAVLLDVGPADRKPPTLPDTALWRPQHRSIPGSVWLPEAGLGDLGAAREAALKARILALAAGDLDRPIVTFCRPDCWGSWNLGKRALGWGFRNVHWFPAGVDGWLEADQPTAIVKPDAEWAGSSGAVR